ncbi:Carbonic anhydrase, putative [Perkinsus marinus ATCC 50983]|uniref:Carbonic anhydrase n=1 Tax=Perkinsus marinus (strain ATCC 50983 / TXsc) TaxID=423536 RepID=C5LCR7_PERM5|nr:Carbonic anhydrase, putative [Perkinsus marinus ATCC 50983]EER05750.1 Carbonic anhydrase, putative [Perkinsus marinus ATCC 50983]|eukprot:XP_002773934.1 Carbonic anhydrase, putative [Perkinsus marinus ATCC 50983]
MTIIPNWSYDDQSSWPGMGTKGKSQSPVSLESAAVDHSITLGDLHLTYGIVDKPILNVSDRGMEVAIAGDQKEYRISNVRDHESDIFVLDQFHAHWGLTDEAGSEHLLHGMSYPMEMHFVHHNEKYGTLDDAKGKTGGLAVLGVLFGIGEANEEVGKILKAVKVGENTVDSIDLYGLIPKDASIKLFGYDGSLTTPTWDENLLWHVTKTTMTISEEQMKMLRSIVGPSGDIIAPNHREVQPLNGRKIYITDGLKEELDVTFNRMPNTV